MTHPIGENVLVTGDAHVQEYSRTFDGLEIHVVLWDETVRRIRALDVGVLHDIGTWECDALVRYPSLDEGDRQGYAIIDTDGIPTLTFAAGEIDLGS